MLARGEGRVELDLLELLDLDIPPAEEPSLKLPWVSRSDGPQRDDAGGAARREGVDGTTGGEKRVASSPPPPPLAWRLHMPPKGLRGPAPNTWDALTEPENVLGATMSAEETTLGAVDWTGVFLVLSLAGATRQLFFLCCGCSQYWYWTSAIAVAAAPAYAPQRVLLGSRSPSRTAGIASV